MISDSPASERIAELEGVVRRSHRCGATHMETTYVIEAFLGRIFWEGNVETFDLEGHPEARRCYAWIVESDRGERIPTTVLEQPSVTGPHAAVSSTF